METAEDICSQEESFPLVEAKSRGERNRGCSGKPGRDLEAPVSQQPGRREEGSCREGLWGLGYKSLPSALGFAEPLGPYHLMCTMVLVDRCYYPNLRAQA